MKKLLFTTVAAFCTCGPFLGFSPAVQGQVLPESSLVPLEAHNLDSIKEGVTRRLLHAAVKSPGRLTYPTLSPDGRQIIYGSFNPRLLDVYTAISTPNQTVKPRKVLDRRKTPFAQPDFDLGASRAYSPDGMILAIGNYGTRTNPSTNSIQLYDTRTWRKMGLLKGHPHSVISLVFSSDGQQLISGNAGGGVIIYDVAKRTILSSWWRGLLYRTDVAFWNHDGQNTPIAVTRKIIDNSYETPKWISGSVFAPEVQAGDFEIWDVASNTRLKVVESVRNDATQPYSIYAPSLSLSPDGRHLAFFSTKQGISDSSGKPYFVTVLDWEKGSSTHVQIPSTLNEIYASFNTLQFVSNDHVLFCDVGQDKLVVIGPQRTSG